MRGETRPAYDGPSMKGGRNNRRRLTLLALTVVGAALLWPASSQAFVACTVSGTELSVNLTADDDSVTFQRFGDQIAVLTGSSLDEYGDYGDYGYGGDTQILIPCSGGTPTVTSIDKVSVVQSPTAEFATVTVDQIAGSFSPGATPEADGTSEIEFGFKLPGRASIVLIGGTDASETFQTGTLPSGAPGVNINAGAEQPSSADPDVEAPGAREIVVFAQGGNDAVSSAGGPGFVGPLRSGFESADGGAGNDVLQAGPNGSGLDGEEGRDTLIGSPREDFFYGGPGKDKIAGGRGNDRIIAVDRKKDTIACGGGHRDNLIADVKDRATRCERVRRLRLPKRRRQLNFLQAALHLH
jgi:Ca2+-binding RTX toxin-like protein